MRRETFEYITIDLNFCIVVELHKILNSTKSCKPKQRKLEKAYTLYSYLKNFNLRVLITFQFNY
jgi:hypothetical protein